jgi:hypothetical protein
MAFRAELIFRMPPASRDGGSETIGYRTIRILWAGTAFFFRVLPSSRMMVNLVERIRQSGDCLRMTVTSGERVTGMSGSERLDSKVGPLGNLSKACFGSLDMLVKGYEPALKGVARWNLELLGFMARRAQAWLEVPSRIGQCKTPVDVLNEQAKFWQAASADYVDGSKRMVAAWSACATMPRLDGTQPRDYITFPEPQESSAAPKRGERKAA